MRHDLIELSSYKNVEEYVHVFHLFMYSTRIDNFALQRHKYGSDYYTELHVHSDK